MWNAHPLSSTVPIFHPSQNSTFTVFECFLLFQPSMHNCTHYLRLLENVAFERLYRLMIFGQLFQTLMLKIKSLRTERAGLRPSISPRRKKSDALKVKADKIYV